MIFDGFPSEERAEAFAALVRSEYGRAATMYLDAGAGRAADPFPFALSVRRHQ